MKSFLDFGPNSAAAPFLGGWLVGMAVFVGIYLAGRGIKRAGLQSGDATFVRLGDGITQSAMSAILALSLVSALGLVMFWTVRP